MNPPSAQVRNDLVTVAAREERVKAFEGICETALVGSFQEAGGRFCLPGKAPGVSQSSIIFLRGEQRRRKVHERKVEKSTKGRFVMMRVLSVAFVAWLSLASAANWVIAEPVQWGESGHWCEVITSTPFAWQEAAEAAGAMSWMSMAGHLATITSQEEGDFIAAEKSQQLVAFVP
jgi:hypothetical protein